MTRVPSGLLAQARFDSPVGPLTAAVTTRGLALLLFGTPTLDAVPVDPTQRWLKQLGQELVRFWHDPQTPFELPLDLQGTAFQLSVWQALRRIPAGQTRSYADIAQQVGAPRAVRAVGAANGANPVAIVVPCHRVIGRNGTLTGYAGGLARKAALLQHESAQQALPA
jgi:methylated-DNA-[protein]-cysteine S-methyltransferase